MTELHEVDMAGCTLLGEIAGDDKAARRISSICGDCGQSVWRCRWLTERKPYPRMAYYQFPAREYMSYVIVECPLYLVSRGKAKKGEK